LKFKLSKGDWKLEHFRGKGLYSKEIERMYFYYERELHDWEDFMPLPLKSEEGGRRN